MTHERARLIITAEAGTHFDASVVEAFVSIEDDFIHYAKSLMDDDVEDPDLMQAA